MKTIIVIFLSFFLSSLSFAKPIKKDMACEILSEANHFKNLLVNDNVEKYIEKMHPKVVKMLGGRGKIIFASEKTRRLMQENEMKVVKYELTTPDNIYNSKNGIFTFLKTYIVIDSPSLEISKNTYIIATKNKKQKNWFFIVGERINNFEALGKIFNEFPNNIKIPKNYRKIVHK